MSRLRIPSAVALACGLMVVAFLVLYYDVLHSLVANWEADENYSHSFVVVPAIAYLIWARRERLAATPRLPSNGGLLLVCAGLMLLVVGTAGVEFFLMRTSLIAVLTGAVAFVAGWRWVRVLLFPLSLTLLVIPVPPVLFYQAAFPLQLLASKFGVVVLDLFHIPVLREGNVIALADTTLEVTEACSGIRSLISLFALAALYAHFAESRTLSRAVITLSSIPIAVIANGLRVAGTGLAAHYVGPWAATGFLHTFSGWVMFMTSFAILIAVANATRALPNFPARRQPGLSTI
jgi:exosortase